MLTLTSSQRNAVLAAGKVTFSPRKSHRRNDFYCVQVPNICVRRKAGTGALAKMRKAIWKAANGIAAKPSVQLSVTTPVEADLEDEIYCRNCGFVDVKGRSGQIKCPGGCETLYDIIPYKRNAVTMW